MFSEAILLAAALSELEKARRELEAKEAELEAAKKEHPEIFKLLDDVTASRKAEKSAKAYVTDIGNDMALSDQKLPDPLSVIQQRGLNYNVPNLWQWAVNTDPALVSFNSGYDMAVLTLRARRSLNVVINEHPNIVTLNEQKLLKVYDGLSAEQRQDLGISLYTLPRVRVSTKFGYSAE